MSQWPNYALKVRTAEHKTTSCTLNLEYAMGCHYVNANYALASTLKFWGFENISSSSRGGDTAYTLIGRESHWICFDNMIISWSVFT